jgi:serralysin
MAKPEWDIGQVITELDSLNHWSKNTITYQIDGLNRTSSLDETSNVGNGIHKMTSAQRGAAQQAFALWDDLIPLSLVQSHNRDANISLNFTSFSGQTFPATGNYRSNGNQLPSRSSHEQAIANSNIWIPDHPTGDGETVDYAGSKFKYGSHQFSTFVHEIGHSLGLHHTGEYNASDGPGINYDDNAMFARDTVQYSIMSYWAPFHYDPTVTYKLNGQDPLIEPSTPMLYDIAAIQKIYGFDPNTRSGNTTYGFHSSFSTVGIDSVYNFSVNDPPVMTIYDAGGNDTLDVSAYHMGQIISLIPGTYSSIGGLTQNVAMALNFGVGANPNSLLENAIGGSGNDSLIGNEVANKLDGRNGNDIVWGWGGNDDLDGGFQADEMYGGIGDDTYFVNDGGDVVDESENGADAGGNDTVRTNLQFYQLANNANSKIENLTFVLASSFTGIGNDLDNGITGNSGNDFLQGEAGNDTLIGGLGRDSMIGGLGNDVFVIDRSSDVPVEFENGGIDEVQSESSTFILGDNIENLSYVGADGTFGNFVGTGNALNNKIYGATFGDTLMGGAGDDYLVGGSGRDTLFGEDGNDTLKGGTRDDQLNGGFGLDTADFSDVVKRTVIDLTEGTAKAVRSTDVETDRLQNIEWIIAGTGDDKIIGDGNDNVFFYSGQFGKFTKTGGLDDYNGGDGSDTVAFSRFKGRVTVDLAAGNATAHLSAENGGGSRLLAEFKNMENVIASSGDDKITGDDHDNTFTYVGAFGYQVERGGFDVYDGGKGSDTLDFSQFVGKISLDLNDGIVGSSYFVDLPDGGSAEGFAQIARTSGMENVIASLSSDTFVGGDGDNSFQYVGSFSEAGFTGGVDNYDGGGGSNTVDMSKFKDSCYINLNSQNLSASYSFHNGNGGGVVVQLLATLANIQNAVGSLQSDTLDGTGEANTLNGQGGNDRLIGREGDDRLRGGKGQDTFVIDAGFGKDTITDFRADGVTTHDTIQFAKSVFADWDHLVAAIADTNDGALITFDASDTITLNDVTKQQLIDNHAADFTFV